MVLGRRYHPNLTLNIQPACAKQIIVVTFRHFRHQRAGEKEQRSCCSHKQITKELIAPCFHKIYMFWPSGQVFRRYYAFIKTTNAYLPMCFRRKGRTRCTPNFSVIEVEAHDETNPYFRVNGSIPPPSGNSPIVGGDVIV